MNRRASHSVRRVRQTIGFDNGYRLLAGMALAPVTGRPADLVFRTDGLSVSCPNRPGARVPVYEVFAEDAYRLDWFTADLGSAPVAVDIGAHIGCFTLALAQLRPGARVESYEASPATAAYTRRNVEANGLGDRVRVHQTAVSAREGFLEFPDNEGGSSLNGITAPDGTRTVQVPCVTIAQAFASAAGQVDLVKIDTEGAEYDMVLASQTAEWAGVRRVVMEYHDVPGHSWDELEKFFDDAGLKVVASEKVSPRQGTVWLSRTALS